jgi:DNA-binding SARP family transcriptional activator
MLRIYLTGDLTIESDRGYARQDRFPGAQGRLVFAMLAAEHDRAVTRDELEAELWPDGPPAAADPALRAVVSKVRGVLADAGLDAAGLDHALGAYRLRLPDDAWIDERVAADAIHRAEPAIHAGDLQEAVGWGRAAASISARPFLPFADGPWARSWRMRLRDIRVRSLDVLATAWLALGDAAQAARDAEAAIAIEPFREPSHRLLIRALDAMGDRADALRAYERLRDRLADELGADPSPETQRLHLELLRG